MWTRYAEVVGKYLIFPVACYQLPKGQLISKADWRTIDSLKKRTDEFVLFAFLLFTANKSNSSVRFLGESMAANLLLKLTDL
jgi:hypothetical protein